VFMNRTAIGFLVLAALFMALVVESSPASHIRPKGASPIRAPFVPAFRQCTTANSGHGAPLSYGSCKPPVQLSPNLTVGTPDVNGAAANAIGFMKFAVKVGALGPPDDSDVALIGELSDIRCLPGQASCGAGNSAGGADYVGELQANASIRVTDHYNGANLDESATGVDISFPANLGCTATADTGIGGLCSITTTANAIRPGTFKDAQRAVVQVVQIYVTDGGSDGLVSTAGNSVFAVEGVFVP
jgi:hypothetical protein